jgi:hypothetical protein
LQDMFGKNGTQNNRNATQTDPLLNRSTTQNQQNSTSTRTGNNGATRSQNNLGGGGLP